MQPTHLVHYSENQKNAVTDSLKLKYIFLKVFRRLKLSVTLEDLNLKIGVPRLQPSAVNPPPHISALLLQQDVIPIQPSAVRADYPLPPPPIGEPIM